MTTSAKIIWGAQLAIVLIVLLFKVSVLWVFVPFSLAITVAVVIGFINLYKQLKK